MIRALRIGWMILGLAASVQASAHELLTAALRLDESAGRPVLATLKPHLGKERQPNPVLPRPGQI